MAHRAFEFIYLISELIVIILYLFCTEYSTTTQGQDFFKSVIIGDDEKLWEAKTKTWTGYVPAHCKSQPEWTTILKCVGDEQAGLVGYDKFTRSQVLDAFKESGASCIDTSRSNRSVED